MEINLVVEGASDQEAAKAVVRAAGHQVRKVIVKRGKSRLDPDIPRYRQASVQWPWIIFRDSDGECPVQLRDRLDTQASDSSRSFQLRIAHTMTEAWFLADSVGFSTFFHVSEGRIHRDPESLDHAKRELLRLCATSRSRRLRDAIVVGDPVAPGPLYVETMNCFAQHTWNVERAAERSSSLLRALQRIREMRRP